MKRDAIDLGTVKVFTLFKKYFIPTLCGMLSMSAVTAIDGIFVGHGIGSDGIAAINIWGQAHRWWLPYNCHVESPKRPVSM